MFRRFVMMIAALAVTIPTAAAAAQAAPTSSKAPVTATANTQDPLGPAPDSFRDPSLAPKTTMPKASPEAKGSKMLEPMVVMPYCRDVYGHYYWMSSSANPASCTQGYVKFYDSRNSDFLGAMDIYGFYWHMSRSTALSTAVSWCTSNWLCNLVVGEIVLRRVGPAWDRIRQVRWGL